MKPLVGGLLLSLFPRAVLIGLFSLLVAGMAMAQEEARFALPPSGVAKVGIIVSKDTTLIDVAGPMAVFDQVPDPDPKRGFQTYTVSESRAPIKAGTLTITPDYTFANAPDFDIIIEPAQRGHTAPYLDYIRRMHERGKLMLSVCTGVNQFAAAGLLDGKQATSHHDFIDGFEKKYPKVSWLRDKAWVHSAPMVYTAGGETSGIELSLHIVELYYDHDMAVKTARYMEYRGPAWQK